MYLSAELTEEIHGRKREGWIQRLRGGLVNARYCHTSLAEKVGGRLRHVNTRGGLKEA